MGTCGFVETFARGGRILTQMELLAHTPAALTELLRGLPPELIHAHEGHGKWSPFDVVGHLVHGEETDWIPRARIILDGGGAFEPFDRDAYGGGSTIESRLAVFARRRARILQTLASWNLTDADHARTGTHPEFGTVTLAELLATCVAHDCSHVAQIARVLAKWQDVGPWRAYLPIVE